MNFTQSSISLLFFVISLYSITCQCSTATSGFVSPSYHKVLTQQQQQQQQQQQPQYTNTNQKNHDCNQRHSSSTMHPLNFMKDIQNSVSSYSTNNSQKSQTQLNAAPIPTLDNWTISKNGEAIGRVSNHPSPNIIDGEMVTTSKLRNVNKIQAKEGSTVTTASGSKYKLGKPKSTGVNFFRSGSNNLSNGNSQAAVETKKPQQKQSLVNNMSKSVGWSFNNKNSSKSNSPSTQAKLEGPLVEDWFISLRGELIGIITGHPDKNIIDGDTVTTSKITSDRKTLKEGDVAVTVNGSKYVLGKKKRGLPTTLFQNREVSSASAQSNGGSFNLGRRAVEICK